MIRLGISILAMGAMAALAAGASGIDGAWVAESKQNNNRRGEVTLTTKLDLKSDGNKLTGTVTTSAGKRARSGDISDGKIEGNRFSFTTVMKTRKGERKLLWEGTLEASELKGSMRNERGRRSASFTARRSEG